MKVSISNIAWDASQDGQVRDLLQYYQVQGVEIAPTKIWNTPTEIKDAAIQEYVKRWVDNGIQLIATQSLLFDHPELTIFQNKETRAKTLVYLQEMIRVSAVLGVRVVVFGSPKNRMTKGLDRREVLDIALPFFTELGETAKQYKVFFCIEPNTLGYGCDFITNTQEGIEFVQIVDHPHIGLNLDVGIMTMNAEPYAEVITQALPYTYHIHISEPFLKQIGRGGADHQAVAAALRQVNYSEWVSIEMKGLEFSDGLKSVESSLKYATDIYR